MSQREVIIVGCGPAGMMAAISAAQSGARVTVLDGNKLPGRKLLMTGNSRCNLTNLAPHMERAYHSLDEDLAYRFASSALSRFSVSATLDFFHELGLLTTLDHESYVYPLSGQAQSVLSLLLAEMKQLGVKVRLNQKVLGLGKDPSSARWQVRTDGWTYRGDAVILACGGKSFPQTGSDGSGYQIAKDLGLAVREPLPALTAVSVRLGRQPVTVQGLKREQSLLYGESNLPGRSPGQGQENRPDGKTAEESLGALHQGFDRRTRKNLLTGLAGVRMTAGVSVWIDRIPSGREIGQVQFTAKDLSGIVVFQVSSRISRALAEGRKAEIRLDLIPSFTEDELETILRNTTERHPDMVVGTVLGGLLPHQLLDLILYVSGAGEEISCQSPAEDLTPFRIRAMAEAIKDLRLEAVSVRGFDSCQVSAGGVDLAQVSPDTLECLREDLAGLCLAGEILDIDGPCGGYNLQWAWSSGYLAGRSAAGA